MMDEFDEIRIVDFDGDCYFIDEAEDGVLTSDDWDAIILDMADDEEMYDDVD
tara:strand:+ start:310 stop:465 length:156 start_codon:yes stop_codon:yes gene_type:complete